MREFFGKIGAWRESQHREYIIRGHNTVKEVVWFGFYQLQVEPECVELTTYDSLSCCGCDIFSFDASAISTIHHSIAVMVQVRDCSVIITECRFYSNKIEYILMLYVSPSMQSSSYSNKSESTKIWALNGGVRDSFFPQWGLNRSEPPPERSLRACDWDS